MAGYATINKLKKDSIELKLLVCPNAVQKLLRRLASLGCCPCLTLGGISDTIQL